MWSLLPRALKILLASTIFANIGSRMYRPFMPLYILALGGDVIQVGIFSTVNTMAAALLRPLGGWFSDSAGRLQAVGIGTIFGLAGFIGYTLSPTWEWLLVSAVLLAGGRALVGPSFRAFTAESAPEGKTAQTFGLVNGVFMTCQIIGPALGGWMVAGFGIRAMFWGATGFMVVASGLRIWAAWGLPIKWGDIQFKRLKTSFRSLFTGFLVGGILFWLMITDGLRDIGVKFYQDLLPLLQETNGMTEVKIGLLFSLQAVVYVVVNIFGSRLADRWSAAGMLAISGIIHGFALLMLAISPDEQVFILFAIIDGIAFGIGDPAFDALLFQTAPRENLGMTFGLFSTAISVFSMPAPFIGSLLWQGISPAMPFWAGAAFMGTAGVFTWVVLKARVEKLRT